MSKVTIFISYFAAFLLSCPVASLAQSESGGISGKHKGYHGKHAKDASSTVVGGCITTEGGEPIDYATVWLEGTSYASQTNPKGRFSIVAPSGDYELVVSAVGYGEVRRKVSLAAGQRLNMDIKLGIATRSIDEVTVMSSGVGRIKRSAFNAVAVDATLLANTTKSISDAISKAPGIKLRESGGVGSDLQVMLDGFSGDHVKVFIDGVPQEGVGSAFGLGNIPAAYAERIEVYKGVVPVGFGTDALGGVINIVTSSKRRAGWYADASYSYGSFNTHKTNVNVGQTLSSGFTWELTAFQNYSDNNYYVDEAVKQFEADGTSYIDNSNIERVRRFHDTYHNEAAVAKIGFTGKRWADRILFGFTFANMYKDIQTGVTQDVVFGGKYRRGRSFMPSFEWRKRDAGVKGLELALTANYNRNLTWNVDTSNYEYNWYGQMRSMSSPGEQSYQHTQQYNDNWNGTFNANYRIGRAHLFTFNHVLNTFKRNSKSLLTATATYNNIAMQTRKNVSGLSYRFMMSDKWNVTAFGKYYRQFVAGPIAVDSNNSDYVRTSRSVDAWGYGAAGTWFTPLSGMQLKASWEKAYRLPTNSEMFGDGDLETENVSLRPENSHNVNDNLSYDRTFNRHSVYAELGFVWRNIHDYIEREIQGLSGGKTAAGYVNHGHVVTKGVNVSARYAFGRWLSVGGNFTSMDIRDREPYTQGTTNSSATYGDRMPNLPYTYSNIDATFYWHGLGGKGCVLSAGYDNTWLHSFTRYAPGLGSDNSNYLIPMQFSHNINLSYSIKDGRYNFSFECINITDANLYDNFRLQKPGRAFYGKVRVTFGGKNDGKD